MKLRDRVLGENGQMQYGIPTQEDLQILDKLSFWEKVIEIVKKILGKK